jgi:hypothetical protein
MYTISLHYILNLTVEANDGLTGYIIDAYSAYINHEEDWYDDFVRKISIADRDEQ